MKKKNSYDVIGLMSGTSLDGLDLAHCSFQWEADRWHFDILHYASQAYDHEWSNRLKNAINSSTVALLELDIAFGQFMGNAVKEFVAQHAIQADFIASHGHTVFHQPEKRLTLQIGSGQELANVAQQKVICDFRTKDVLNGGQGAPLVPIGDHELFYDYDCCLNLGGISNLSFQKDGQRIAYDIGPANMLLNHLANQLDLTYDEDGKMAATGKVNASLLAQFNALEYYQLSPPKSLGFEWFREAILPILNPCTIPLVDQLRTAVQHIAELLASDLLRQANNQKSRILITGGGAKNKFLIQTLNQLIPAQLTLVIPDTVLIDYKEALIFAFMGVKRIRSEINCLKSVTGAHHDCSSGIIFYP